MAEYNFNIQDNPDLRKEIPFSSFAGQKNLTNPNQVGILTSLSNQKYKVTIGGTLFKDHPLTPDKLGEIEKYVCTLLVALKTNPDETEGYSIYLNRENKLVQKNHDHTEKKEVQQSTVLSKESAKALGVLDLAQSIAVKKTKPASSTTNNELTVDDLIHAISAKILETNSPKKTSTTDSKSISTSDPAIKGSSESGLMPFGSDLKNPSKALNFANPDLERLFTLLPDILSRVSPSDIETYLKQYKSASADSVFTLTNGTWQCSISKKVLENLLSLKNGSRKILSLMSAPKITEITSAPHQDSNSVKSIITDKASSKETDEVSSEDENNLDEASSFHEVNPDEANPSQYQSPSDEIIETFNLRGFSENFDGSSHSSYLAYSENSENNKNTVVKNDKDDSKSISSELEERKRSLPVEPPKKAESVQPLTQKALEENRIQNRSKSANTSESIRWCFVNDLLYPLPKYEHLPKLNRDDTIDRSFYYYTSVETDGKMVIVPHLKLFEKLFYNDFLNSIETNKSPQEIKESEISSVLSIELTYSKESIGKATIVAYPGTAFEKKGELIIELPKKVTLEFSQTDDILKIQFKDLVIKLSEIAKNKLFEIIANGDTDNSDQEKKGTPGFKQFFEKGIKFAKKQTVSTLGGVAINACLEKDKHNNYLLPLTGIAINKKIPQLTPLFKNDQIFSTVLQKIADKKPIHLKDAFGMKIEVKWS